MANQKIGFIIVAIERNLDEAKKLLSQVKRYKISGLTSFIIVNKEDEEGYAHGVNKGIAKALKSGCGFFVVANPDIQIHFLSKKILIAPSKFFDVWGYGFKQHGKTYFGGVIDRLRLTAGLKEKKSNEKLSNVNFVSGSLVCFTKTAVKKIGLWNETYGMYYEDVDFATEARKRGLRVGIVNKVLYTHYENSTMGRDKEGALFVSRWRYFIRHAGLLNYCYELFRLPKTLFEHRTLIAYEVRKRPFFFNFLTLNFSSLSVKILNFILFLFLVRLFSSREFGQYNLVWAQIALFMPLADLGTTNYGIFHLKKAEGKSFSVLHSLRLVLAGVIMLVTLLYAYLLFGPGDIVNLTILTLPVIASNAVSGSFLILTTLQAQAYVASMVSLVFNSALIIALIASAALSGNLYVLFMIEGLFVVFYSIYLWIRIKKEVGLRLLKPSLKSFVNIIKQSYLYILLNFFAGLYFKLDLFLLQFFKGFSSVGIYSAGYKFFEALIFFGASYTIAATPVYKNFLEKNPPAIFHKMRRDSILLFVLGMVVAVSGWFASPLILPFALGPGYEQSIEVFRIAIFAFPFLLVSAVAMNILYLLKKTHWVVFIFLAQLAINFFGNLYFVPLYSFYASAIITVISEVVNATISVLLFRKAYADIS